MKLRVAAARGMTGLVCLCAVATAPAAAQHSAPASAASRGVDSRWSLASAGDRVVLLFFVASDCPVSNRYFPEMERLSQQFASRGVRTWYVYPNSGETLDGVRKHQAEFHAAPQEARLDSTGQLVSLAHARTTPEASLLVRTPSGELTPVYTGRIDDRYVNIGLERAHAEHHDLQVALEAVLAGKPAPGAGGPPVGCSIVPHEVAGPDHAK